MSDYVEIDSTRWKEMSTTELYEQLSVLRGRAYSASMMGNLNVLKQVQSGINKLEKMIADKTDHDDTLTI